VWQTYLNIDKTFPNVHSTFSKTSLWFKVFQTYDSAYGEKQFIDCKIYTCTRGKVKFDMKISDEISSHNHNHCDE